MSIRQLATSLLTNVVAGILVFLLSPALAVTFGALGWEPIVEIEGETGPSVERIPEDRLAGLEPSPPAPPPPAQSPPPAKPESDPYVKVRKTCRDSHGNEGVFDVVLFSRAYSWVQGDTENVELNDTPADFPTLLGTSALGGHLRESPEIVALGTASCEGFPEHREREVERARKRANKLLGWIEAVRPPRSEWERWKPVKPLPLGVFARECRPGEETWSQRRVVLLAVRERDDELLLFDCLRRTLEEDDELSYLATAYTPGFPKAQDGAQEVGSSP